MRLTDFEVNSIKQTFLSVFKSGDIYLFGSRVDDSKRGGDIDLYIKNYDTDNLLEKKLNFLSLLKQKMGDQKIDIILAKDKTRIIEKVAMRDGIEL